jgi:hypothetical protein
MRRKKKGGEKLDENKQKKSKQSQYRGLCVPSIRKKTKHKHKQRKKKKYANSK